MINGNNILTDFKESLRELASFMIADLKEELENQGHVLTGKLRDSIEMVNLGLSAGNLEALVELEDYYGIIDRGIPAGRIPFNPGSGRRSSKYIEGLINFWMIKKGLGQKEATRAAFALAWKHKKEGMPTQSSWAFSKNGRRMDFFTRTLDDSQHYDQFETDLQDRLEFETQAMIDEFQNNIK